MGSKGHFIISLMKSTARIISGLATVITGNIYFLAIGIVVAEILGILEELADKR